MNTIYVIGMGVSASDLTEAHLAIIRAADLLVGGRRHLDRFKDLPAEKRPIDGRVSETLACIRAAMAHRRVVVLASGDPLLHGIGSRIAEEIGRERVTVLPNVSSIAAAFARIGQSWAGARVVSLHGRDSRLELLAALKSGAPVAVLTDPQRTPAWLAAWLRERGVDHVDMAVFEQLGDAQEQVGWYPLDQAAGRRFAEPNLVVLKPGPECRAIADRLALGMS
jgi:precorrin-6Y C5,15-methyltransferase (decarboxylating)